jgi:hypothetical protein
MNKGEKITILGLFFITLGFIISVIGCGIVLNLKDNYNYRQLHPFDWWQTKDFITGQYVAYSGIVFLILSIPTLILGTTISNSIKNKKKTINITSSDE